MGFNSRPLYSQGCVSCSASVIWWLVICVNQGLKTDEIPLLGQGGVVRRTGVVRFFQPPSLPAALLDLRRATRGKGRYQTYSFAFFFRLQPSICTNNQITNHPLLHPNEPLDRFDHLG